MVVLGGGVCLGWRAAHELAQILDQMVGAYSMH